MTAQYSFTLNQGTDLSVPFVLKNKDQTPVDLSGSKIAMQLRKFTSDSEAIDTLTTANDRIKIEPEKGRFVCIFPHENTEKYPVIDLVYDIELVSSGGLITRIVEGSITVIPEVTRCSAVTL